MSGKEIKLYSHATYVDKHNLTLQSLTDEEADQWQDSLSRMKDFQGSMVVFRHTDKDSGAITTIAWPNMGYSEYIVSWDEGTSLGTVLPMRGETFGNAIAPLITYEAPQHVKAEQQVARPSFLVAKNAGDAAFLEFIWARMKEVHGENENYDYMHVLKEFVDLFKEYGPEIAAFVKTLRSIAGHRS